MSTPSPVRAPGHDAVLEKLVPLGIAYIVLGVVDILWAVVTVASSLFGAAAEAEPSPGEEVAEPATGLAMVFGRLGLVWFGLAAVVGAGTVVAGLKLRRARDYRWCVAAIAANMIPCCHTACFGLAGIPLGIWALVVLSREDVHAVFYDNG